MITYVFIAALALCVTLSVAYRPKLKNIIYLSGYEYRHLRDCDRIKHTDKNPYVF